MKIITFNASGDTTTETSIVEDAERILREWQAKGGIAVQADGTLVAPPLRDPMPEEVYLLFAMAGGMESRP